LDVILVLVSRRWPLALLRFCIYSLSSVFCPNLLTGPSANHLNSRHVTKHMAGTRKYTHAVQLRHDAETDITD
jgi:hypothetical protein